VRRGSKFCAKLKSPRVIYANAGRGRVVFGFGPLVRRLVVLSISEAWWFDTRWNSIRITMGIFRGTSRLLRSVPSRLPCVRACILIPRDSDPESQDNATKVASGERLNETFLFVRARRLLLISAQGTESWNIVCSLRFVCLSFPKDIAFRRARNQRSVIIYREWLALRDFRRIKFEIALISGRVRRLSHGNSALSVLFYPVLPCDSGRWLLLLNVKVPKLLSISRRRECLL